MRISLKIGLIILLVVSCGKTGEPPNILLINADDLGYTDLSCMGSEYYRTPNIDALAESGMLFTQAYAAASNCAPSRACLMTGNWTPRHGVYTVGNPARGRSIHRKLIPIQNQKRIEAGEITIAGILQEAGYRTCHVGKWHISDDPIDFGFDVNIGGTDRGHPSSYFSPYNNPRLADGDSSEYLTDRLTSEAIAFLESSGDTAFFMNFATFTVHSPLQAKPDKTDEYRERQPSDAHDDPVYAAMIESLDENVGRLISALAGLGRLDNTLIVFTSDNGGVFRTSRQWPLRAGKGSYYEGGIREPLLISWKNKIRSGSKCEIPVSQLDLFPTFLEIAGIGIPEEKVLDGLSLVPLFKGATIEERALYWHFPIYLEAYDTGFNECRDKLFRTRPGSAIRHGDYKLHEYFEDGGLELYNLKSDTGEKNNIAGSNPEKTQELLGMLRAWRSETGAPVPREPNPDYFPQ